MATNTRVAKTAEKGSRTNGKKKPFSASTPPRFNGDDDGKEGVAEPLDQKGEDAEKYLYSVTSRSDIDHDGHWYHDVPTEWICSGRDYAFAPPAEVIRDYPYGQDGWRTDERLTEFFTVEEAVALQDCLSRCKDVTMTRIEKVAISFGPGFSTREWLTEHPDGRGDVLPDDWGKEALPFKVWGYYNVNGMAKQKPCVCLCPFFGKKSMQGQVRDASDADELPCERPGNT